MSDFLKVVDNGASRTFIVFSPARIRAGRFSGIRAFSSLDSNYVFVNCPDNTWFLNPIPGVGDTPQEIVSRLEQELNRLGSAEVITYGGSMGGYGAVLYGAMLGVDHCVATGVEVELGLEGAFFNKLCAQPVAEERRQLFARALGRAANTQFHFFYGEQCAYDLLGALKLPQQANIHVHTILNEDHSIPPLLDHLFGMQAFVLACGSGEPDKAEVPWAHMLGNMMNYPDAIRALYHHDVLGEKGTEMEATLAEHIPNMDPVSASVLEYRLALMKKERKDIAGAHAHVVSVVANNPDYYLALCNAAHFSLMVDEEKEALGYARRAMDFIIDGVRPFYHARYTLVRCLARNGLIEEAWAELQWLIDKFAHLPADNQHNVRIAGSVQLIEKMAVKHSARQG